MISRGPDMRSQGSEVSDRVPKHDDLLTSRDHDVMGSLDLTMGGVIIQTPKVTHVPKHSDLSTWWVSSCMMHRRSVDIKDGKVGPSMMMNTTKGMVLS